MKKPAFVFFAVAALFMSLGARAQDRACAQLSQLKEKAQQEVVERFQAESQQACIEISAKFSIGVPVKDRYTFTYLCKNLDRAQKITQITVEFRDSERRYTQCPTLENLAMTQKIEKTDREF